MGTTTADTLGPQATGDRRPEVVALLQKAGAQLLDAASMLRVEAQEWRDRKGSISRSWIGGISEWASKCERIAEINTSAATSFEATAKNIAKAIGERSPVTNSPSNGS